MYNHIYREFAFTSIHLKGLLNIPDELKQFEIEVISK